MKSRNILYLLLFLPLLLVGFYIYGLFFGCALGNVHTFDCRVIIPISGISLIIDFIIVVSLFFSVSKIKWSLYFLFLLVFPVFIGIYSTLPSNFKLAYLEGYTMKACAEGKSTVPWGQSFSSDSCYYILRECKYIKDLSQKDNCYFPYWLPGNGGAKGSEDCRNIVSEDIQTQCLNYFGAQEKPMDSSRCDTMINKYTDPLDEHLFYEDKMMCYQNIAQFSPGCNQECYYAINGESSCGTFTGFNRDYCYFRLAQNHLNQSQCSDISNNSLKGLCGLMVKYENNKTR